MSTWADEYITLIEDCEARSERLSDWEAQFLDSLRRQLSRHEHDDASIYLARAQLPVAARPQQPGELPVLPVQQRADAIKRACSG